MDLPRREMENMMEEGLASPEQETQDHLDFSAEADFAENPVFEVPETTAEVDAAVEIPSESGMKDYADLNFSQELQEAGQSLITLLQANKDLLKQLFSSFAQIGIALLIVLKFWLKNRAPFLKKERNARMKQDHQHWKTLSETQAHFNFEKKETVKKRWKLAVSVLMLVAVMAAVLNLEKLEEPLHQIVEQTRHIVPKLEIQIPDNQEEKQAGNEPVIKEKNPADDQKIVVEEATRQCELSESQVAWIQRKYDYLKKYTPGKKYSLVQANRCDSQYDGVVYLANGKNQGPVAVVKFRKDYDTLEEFIIVEMEKFQGGRKPDPYVGSIISTKGPFNYISQHLKS